MAVSAPSTVTRIEYEAKGRLTIEYVPITNAPWVGLLVSGQLTQAGQANGGIFVYGGIQTVGTMVLLSPDGTNWNVPRVPIVVNPLSAVSIITADEELLVSWQNAVDTTGALLQLLDANNHSLGLPVVAWGTSGQIPLSGPIQSGWTLVVSGAHGRSDQLATGPSITVNLLPTSPVVQDLRCDAALQTLTATLSGTPPGGTVGAVALLADGTPVSFAVGQNPSPLQVAVQAPSGMTLPGGPVWSVRPFWYAAALRGPQGPPTDAIIVAPQLTEVVVGDGVVTTSWEEFGGPPWRTGVEVTIGAEAGTVTGKRPVSVQPKTAPTTGTAFALRSARGVAYSAPATATLIADQTPISSAAYDGDHLIATWGTGTAGNAATLLVRRDGETVASAEAGALGGAVVAALDPAASYTVAVRWSDGVIVGPPGPELPVITAPAVVSAIQMTSTGCTVTVAAGPGGAAARGEVMLEAGGVLLATSAPFDASSPTATFALSVPGDAGLTARARWIGASGTDLTGPLGPRVVVPSTRPRITGISLSAGQISAAWEPPPGDAPVQLTELAITPSEGNPVTLGTSGEQSGIWPVPKDLTLQAGLSYAVTAFATLPSGATLASPPVALIPSAPTVSQVAARDGGLDVTWTWPEGASGASTATGYRIELLDGPTVLATATATGLTGRLPLPAGLSLSTAYQVAVSPLGPDTSTAAASGPAALLGPPVITSAASSSAADKVELSWQPAVAPGGAITSYQARFTTPVAAPVVVALTTQTGPEAVSLPQGWAKTGAPIFVDIEPVGSNALGPPSSRLRVVSGTPILGSARYDGSAQGGLLSVGWEPAEGATRYDVVLLASGKPTGTTVTVSSTEAQLPVQLGALTDPFTVAVTPRSGASAGPATTSAPLALLAPGVSAPTFDGRTLSVTVAAGDDGSTPTGYALRLLRDGQEVTSANVGIPGHGTVSLVVDEPVVATASYSVEVRTLAGPSIGGRATATVILSAPRVLAASVAEANISVTLTGPAPAPTSVQAVLLVDGAVQETKPVDGQGQATFALVAGKENAVAGQFSGGGITGPLSAPVPVPITTLSITTAYCDGRRLGLTWAGGDPAHRYAVAVGSGIATVIDGEAAVLPLEPVAGSAYTVTVTELAGVASGPPTTQALVTEAPVVSAAACTASGTLTPSWTWPNGDTFQAVLVEGAFQRSLGPIAQGGSVTVPTGTSPASAVAIRAISGPAVGPIGNAAPLLLETPAAPSVDYDGSRLRVTWAALVDDRVDGYAVSTGDGHTTRVTVPEFTLSTDGSTPLTITVAATAGPTTGPATAGTPVLLQKPTIASTAYDGMTVTVTWTAPASPATTVTGYRVDVASDCSPVATADVGPGVSATTLAVPSGLTNLTVTVAALASAGSGPPCPPAALLSALPAVSGMTTNPITGQGTVSWSAVAGARYDVQVTVDGTPDTPVSASGPSVEIGPLSADADATVRVRAKTATQTGPFSAAYPLMLATPAITGADYDGASVTVSWKQAAGATGYMASVLATVGGTVLASSPPVGPGARTVSFAATLSNTAESYAVVVQANRGQDSGPASAQEPLAAQELHLALDGSAPRLFRSGPVAPAPAAVTAYLPAIGIPAGTTIPTTENPTFQIAPSTGSPSFPFTLAIANAALQWTAAARIQVQSDYTTLLTAAQNAGATAWGIHLLQETIARLLPQTFEETLLYAYGLSAGSQHADLRPGMIVQVALAHFDQPTPRPPSLGPGYAPAGTVQLEVGEYANPADAAKDWLVGLDQFIAWLTTHGDLTILAPTSTGTGPAYSQSGAADAADLFFAGMRQPFLRLLFPQPPGIEPTSAPSSATTARAFTIAAAPTWTALQSVSSTPTGPTAAVGLFRGRAVIRLAIRILVDGAPHVVPIGTTVGNVLDSLGRRPPAAGITLSGIRLRRGLGQAVLDPSGPYGATLPVRLDWTGLGTYGTTTKRDVLSLPLLHGDRLTLA